MVDFPGRLSDKVKLACAGGLFLVSLVACVWLAVGKSHAEHRAAKFETAIEHPRTGYKVRLERWRAAAGAWQAAVGRQNAAIDAWKRDRDAAVSSAEMRVALANRSRRSAEAESRRLMAAINTLKGATACERFLEADRKVLEGLR
jgi:hypothetical protein